jgi:hypothetical protein
MHNAFMALSVFMGLALSGAAQGESGDEFKAQRALFDYDHSIPLGVVDNGVEKRPHPQYRRRTSSVARL